MSSSEDCAIPARPSISAIKKAVIAAPDHQARDVIRYAEIQLNKGRGKKKKQRVTHLEKIKTEYVYGTEYVAWDVHTDTAGRWWVITGLTNLYSQEEFPSLDYTLSFHIGLTARIGSGESKKAPEDSSTRLLAAWRRWETAAGAMDAAKEPEDYQAIGMRCREALIEIARMLQGSVAVKAEDRPKAADFVEWSKLIADHYAGGGRNERIRSYLKSNAKETWQLANWLTHTSGAVHHEATITLDATANFISVMSIAVTLHEADAPSACPKCKSHRIVSVFEPDMQLDPPYVNLCESCGWNSVDG